MLNLKWVAIDDHIGAQQLVGPDYLIHPNELEMGRCDEFSRLIKDGEFG